MRLPLLGLLLATRALAQLPQPPSLSQSQTDSIGNGRLVWQHQAERGAPWPRIWIHHFIKATPEECAAMFSDYEHQLTYFDGLKSVRIVERKDPVSTVVSFHYSLRFWPDAKYTVLDVLRRIGASDYAITWTLVDSPAASRAEGAATFVAWRNPVTGEDGTLFTYEHFVLPKSAFAKLVPDRVALGEAQKAARAIKAHVEHERTNEPDRLTRQLTTLRVALGH